jgi:hypothetical protein
MASSEQPSFQDALSFNTTLRGTNQEEYAIYKSFADDGNGGDTTNNGHPLKTFDQWLNS